MDTYALGLRAAAKIQKDGRIEGNLKERYASFEKGVGKEIVEGKTDFEKLAQYAKALPSIEVKSGKQEYLESVINSLVYGG